MIRPRILAALPAIALYVGLAACTDRPPLSSPVPAVAGPYRLGAGDQLRIVVYDQPSLTNLYEVSQSGEVAFPLIGDVAARNATPDELEAQIEARLATAYLRDPDVSVEVAVYRPFFVLGEVGDPGQYPYVPGMTVENAVAAAGGFTERANKRVARLSRKVHGELYEARIAVTDLIQPGDTVYVPESLF